MREWTVNIMNKIRIISVLLSICILLTACSATGASSVASSAPASSESASSAPAAARPMDYDTYFSASRPIESHAGRYISDDTLTLHAENGEYLMPFPAAPGKYAETEKGVLILRDYDGIYLLGNITPAYTSEAYEEKVRAEGFPYHIAERVTVKNFRSDTGKKWKLSPNPFMFRHVAVTDLDEAN